MAYIHNKGNPSSDIWVIVNRPLPNDIDRKYVFSSGIGYVFDKMMKEAGLGDYFVTCYCPDTDSPNAYRNIDGELNSYRPSIILAIDTASAKLCTELVPKRQGKNYDPDVDSEISKYCGSLLRSQYLSYPHYVMPLLSPSTIVQQYKLREQVLLDLCKAKHEIEYVKKHGNLQPLPIRKLEYNFADFDELLYIIDSFVNSEYISTDIETIYPKSDSKYYGQTPGVPVVIGLAPSKDFGISFDMFREKVCETRRLWQSLDRVFRNTKIIGQNFFNFDSYYLEALGFEFDYESIYDTLIRHHVLWPELPHSLQYMTRQYTREPYYKDEGQGWSPKNMEGLKRYNCLDATVTYEVFEGEEQEFDDRPHLR
jgi:hypothetical protein